ncbi:RraA family protein [candidate division KSB1 bacterium]|nr:RraA family protein [candidate division KSB1 bacterium]
MTRTISHAELLELKRWNTPTVYNGWEQITRHNTGREGFNLEPVTDFMPQMGPMAGYAVTVMIEPGNRNHLNNNPDAVKQYLEYVASVAGPKIVVVQDLDKPVIYGAFWGEVNSNLHRALGCIGTITDGGIRDTDEMNNAGFKALARGVCVGHAWSTPVKWNCEVEVFGRKVLPGQLIHADKHGFLVIPDEDQEKLLEATRFMDSNECNTIISAARNTAGKSAVEILAGFHRAVLDFNKSAEAKFGRKGEW